jgi:hypothetical protein
MVMLLPRISLRLVLSLDITTIETAKINLSVLQQTETGKGINIAGCLVLEQSRGIENGKKSS